MISHDDSDVAAPRMNKAQHLRAGLPSVDQISDTDQPCPGRLPPEPGEQTLKQHDLAMHVADYRKCRLGAQRRKGGHLLVSAPQGGVRLHQPKMSQNFSHALS